MKDKHVKKDGLVSTNQQIECNVSATALLSHLLQKKKTSFLYTVSFMKVQGMEKKRKWC